MAGSGRILELIADPAQQPRCDGNDDLAGAPAGQHVSGTGDLFTMTLTGGDVWENHVVEGTRLTDENRLPRARASTADRARAARGAR